VVDPATADPATVADRSRLPDGSAHQPPTGQQISECRGVPPTPDWTWAPAETSTRARVFNGSSDSNPCRYPQHRGPTGRKLHPMQTAQEQPCDLMHVPKTRMIGCGCDHSPRRGQFNTFGFSALSPSEQTSCDDDYQPPPWEPTNSPPWKGRKSSFREFRLSQPSTQCPGRETSIGDRQSSYGGCRTVGLPAVPWTAPRSHADPRRDEAMAKLQAPVTTPYGLR
jgi:hypothetical protein